MTEKDHRSRSMLNLVMPRTQIILLAWLVCAAAIGYAICEFSDVARSLFNEFFTEENRSGGTIVLIVGAALCLCFVAVLIFISLIGANHLVGPVYRTLEMLKQIESGDYQGEMRLRRRDAFPQLTDQFNNTLAALRAEREKNKAS